MSRPTMIRQHAGGQDQIRLGRIAGFPVEMNWSVLVIAWLLTWSLATGGLPHGAPGHPPSTYWVAGAIAAAAFLVSLLAHEVAHALVARRDGIEVTGVTLWLFGGVASLARDPSTPAADLRVAAAGPATSLTLAGAFGVMSLALDTTGVPHLLASVTGWLAGVNLMLGVFNLLPGAPLDGGRVLRAILWRLRGDRHRATLVAAKAGAVIGYGLIGSGLVQFLVAGGIGGLWLVFIGWFLLSAARAEEAHERTRHSLAGVTVAEVMTPVSTAIPSWLTVADAIDRYALSERHDTWLVEGFDGHAADVVTVGALRAVPPRARDMIHVSEIASAADELPHVRATATVVELLDGADNIRRSPVLVTDTDRVIGTVTTADLERIAGLRLGNDAAHR